MNLKKGMVIYNPNDLVSGYVVMQDVNVGDDIVVEQFTAFGLATKPVTGDSMPDWLYYKLEELANQKN